MLQHADQSVFLIGLHKIVDNGFKGDVHTLMLADLFAVDIDLGGIVDAAEPELQRLLKLFFGNGKGGAVGPPAAAYPLAVEGIPVEIRVLDEAGSLQVPVNAAGDGGVDPGDQVGGRIKQSAFGDKRGKICLVGQGTHNFPLTEPDVFHRSYLS